MAAGGGGRLSRDAGHGQRAGGTGGGARHLVPPGARARPPHPNLLAAGGEPRLRLPRPDRLRDGRRGLGDAAAARRPDQRPRAAARRARPAPPIDDGRGRCRPALARRASTTSSRNTGPTGQRALAARRRRAWRDGVPPPAWRPADAGPVAAPPTAQAVAAHILAWARDGRRRGRREHGTSRSTTTCSEGPEHWVPTSRIVQQQSPLLPGWGENRTLRHAHRRRPARLPRAARLQRPTPASAFYARGRARCCDDAWRTAAEAGGHRPLLVRRPDAVVDPARPLDRRSPLQVLARRGRRRWTLAASRSCAAARHRRWPTPSSAAGTSKFRLESLSGPSLVILRHPRRDVRAPAHHPASSLNIRRGHYSVQFGRRRCGPDRNVWRGPRLRRRPPTRTTACPPRFFDLSSRRRRREACSVAALRRHPLPLGHRAGASIRAPCIGTFAVALGDGGVEASSPFALALFAATAAAARTEAARPTLCRGRGRLRPRRASMSATGPGSWAAAVGGLDCSGGTASGPRSSPAARRRPRFLAQHSERWAGPLRFERVASGGSRGPGPTGLWPLDVDGDGVTDLVGPASRRDDPVSLGASATCRFEARERGLGFPRRPCTWTPPPSRRPGRWWGPAPPLAVGTYIDPNEDVFPPGGPAPTTPCLTAPLRRGLRRLPLPLDAVLLRALHALHRLGPVGDAGTCGSRTTASTTRAGQEQMWRMGAGRVRPSSTGRSGRAGGTSGSGAWASRAPDVDRRRAGRTTR